MAWKLFPHTHAHKRKLCTSRIETYIHITHSPYCFRISLEQRKCSLVVQNYNVKRNGQEAVTHHPCIQIPYNISLLNKTQSDNLCSLSSGWCVHGHRTNASLFFPMHCPNNHLLSAGRQQKPETVSQTTSQRVLDVCQWMCQVSEFLFHVFHFSYPRTVALSLGFGYTIWSSNLYWRRCISPD